MKKLLAALLACVMLTSSMTVFADDVDADALASIDGHWAEDYILYLNEKEVILPTKDPNDTTKYSFTPDTQITRAEFMRYINRAFSLENTATIDFVDVAEGSWYYDDIAKAVYWGYIEGLGNNQMCPLNYLTRQEAVVIISRLHNLEPNEDAELDFTDADDIASWASGYIAKAVELGYVSGRSGEYEGAFDPLGYITRGEIAKILYLFAGNILDLGDYEGDDLVQDNITIGDTYVSLSDAEVDGTILITNAYQTSLTDVTVGGDIIVASGTLILEDVSVDNIIINAPSEETVKVTVKDNCDIGNIYVYTPATINSTVEAGVDNIIECMTTPDSDMTISGYFDYVEFNSVMVDATLTDCEIGEVYVTKYAVDADIDLDEDCVIQEMTIKSECAITGDDGTIVMLYVDCDDVTIKAVVCQYDIDDDYSAKINSKSYSGRGYLSSYNTDLISIESLIFRYGDEIMDRVISVSFDVSDIESITHEGDELDKGDDYTYSTKYSTITFYEDLIWDLDDGDEIIIEIYDSADIELEVIWVDDDENYIQISKLVYDFDLEDDDLEFEFFPLSYDELSEIVIGDEELSSRDYDYDYDDDEETHTITIDYSYLEELEDGEYEVVIEMEEENDLTFTLEIRNNPNFVEEYEFTITFLDEDYDEVSGVKVTIDDRYIEYTDSDGEVVFQLDPDKYIMEYSKSGYQSGLQWIDSSDGDDTFRIIMTES